MGKKKSGKSEKDKGKKKRVEAGPVSRPVVFTLTLSLAAHRAQPVLFQQVTLAGGLLAFVILKQGLTVQLCVAWPILSRPGRP